MRHLVPRVRSLFPFALILAVGGFVRAEAQLPRVIITLMPDVPYERVSVTTFCMALLERREDSYESQALGRIQIPIVVEGKPASQIKMFIGAPGCKTATFDIAILNLLDTQESFSCNSAPTVTLVGQIRPASLLRNKDATVSVDYMAGWACGFFGFGDCMVPQISLGTVKPDTDGIFKIDLPDFSADPIGSDADSGTGLQFILRDAKRTTFSRSSIQSRKRYAIRVAL